VIRLTLLRSPTMPDPMADIGEHQFKYSLYPHRGSWSEETQREAYLLNDPIIVYQRQEERGNKPVASRQSPVSILQSLVSVSSPNVIVETVKRAEDGDGIIVRLYESQRKRGPVRLRAGFSVAAAWETNLLEENETTLSLEGDSIQLNLTPYQIMTLRVKPK
jgi:alpha-mannosidase